MAASGFTIPNEADAGHAHQARLFETDIDILVAGLAGDGVVTGCAVSDNASGLTVDVAVGVIRVAGANVDVAAGSVTPGAANGSNPRFDLVVVSNAGTKSIIAGTAAANPVPPAVPANSVCLATLYIRAAVSTLAAADIIDKRAILSRAKGTSIGIDNAANKQYGVPGGSYTAVVGGVSYSAASDDIIRYVPVHVTEPITITDMVCEVASVGGTVSSADGRLGIYKASDSWQPGVLVLDAGTVSLTTAGIKTITGLTTVLTRGKYLFAFHIGNITGAGASVVMRAYGMVFPVFSGVVSGLGASGIVQHIQASKAWGALSADGEDWDETGGTNSFQSPIFARWTT